jgi:hypothetical protein
MFLITLYPQQVDAFFAHNEKMQDESRPESKK